MVEASSTTSGQTLKGGLSELTICLIVLPVIIVLLIAVLLCVAVPKGRSKMPNSTHCCFRSGRNANNGEAAALTVSTAASSPSSTMNQVLINQQIWDCIPRLKPEKPDCGPGILC